MKSLPLTYNNSVAKSAGSQYDALDKLSLFIVLISCVLAAIFPYLGFKIFLAFALGSYFIYLVFARIDLALCFFIFFMPLMDLFPPDFFIVKGINAPNLIVGLFILGAMAQPNQIEYEYHDPLKWPIIFLALVVSMSLINSALFTKLPFGELFAFAKNWLMFAIFYFVTLTKCKPEHHKKLFFTMLVTVALVAIFSLRYLVENGFVFSERDRNLGGVLADQPNLFGGFLAMYIPFFIAILRTKTARIWVGIGLLGCLVALMTTLSRGAWLAFFASLLFLGVLKDIRFILVVVLALLTSPFWLPETVVNRYKITHLEEGSYKTYENQQYDGSTEVRRLQWRGLFKMMSVNPIIGSGLMTFPDVVFKQGVMPERFAPHSTFVAIAVEEGVLGIIAYLWILITVFTNARFVSKISADPFYKAAAAGLMGCVVALFVTDFSGTRFYDYELMTYFWIICAIIVSAKTNLQLKM